MEAVKDTRPTRSQHERAPEYQEGDLLEEWGIFCWKCPELWEEWRCLFTGHGHEFICSAVNTALLGYDRKTAP